MSKRFAVALAAAALVGCGNNGGGGPGGSTLAGSWDLTASTTTSSGTLILDDKSINISIGDYTFLMHVNGAQADLTWSSRYGGISQVKVTHAPAALDLGAIPLQVGGDWTFSTPSGQGGCLGTLSPAAWTGSCTQVDVSTPIYDLYDSPNAHATRVATHDSMFGDLGGDWTVSNGGAAHLDVSVAGNTLQATLYSSAGTTSSEGGLMLAFNGGLASGTTSGGVEFSAQRR
jgi:hypothetical protein